MDDPRMTARVLRQSAVIPASAADVFDAFASAEGAKTFFAPDARIESHIGGAYELYFDLGQPPGARGSEGCTIQRFEPPTRLGFTWNFPPSIPSIRDQHTEVEVQLHAEAPDRTRVTVLQLGFQVGDDWEQGYHYFERAWGLVLSRLKERFEKGPRSWE